MPLWVKDRAGRVSSPRPSADPYTTVTVPSSGAGPMRGPGGRHEVIPRHALGDRRAGQPDPVRARRVAVGGDREVGTPVAVEVARRQGRAEPVLGLALARDGDRPALEHAGEEGAAGLLLDRLRAGGAQAGRGAVEHGDRADPVVLRVSRPVERLAGRADGDVRAAVAVEVRDGEGRAPVVTRRRRRARNPGAALREVLVVQAALGPGRGQPGGRPVGTADRALVLPAPALGHDGVGEPVRVDVVAAGLLARRRDLPRFAGAFAASVRGAGAPAGSVSTAAQPASRPAASVAAAVVRTPAGRGWGTGGPSGWGFR